METTDMGNKWRPLQALATGVPELSDIMYIVKDPDGTPLERKITLDALSDLVGGGPGGGIGGTIASNQIAFGTGVDEIAGSDILTFDNTTVATDAGPYTFRYNNPSITAEALASYAYLEGPSIFMNSDDPAVAQLDGHLIQVVGHSTVDGASFTGQLIQVNNAASADNSGVIGLNVSASSSGGTGSTTIGIRVANIGGSATTKQAIKTGTGDIVFGSLAGTGTRTVVVDANGKLSAP